MSKPPDLRLSQEAFEELHRRLDKVRKGTTEVKVPSAALRDLLMDHSNLLKNLFKLLG